MCLILLAIDSHPHFPLIVAANRDEFYARPTRPLQPWPEKPQLLAGKDLQAGGTWFGLTRSGRFAAITNVRSGPPRSAQQRSRGELTRAFLLDEKLSAENFIQTAWREGAQYAGFNLLLGDREGLYYCSNHGEAPHRLRAGIYGLANARLDTPWPKVESGKAELRAVLQQNPEPAALLRLLADTTPARDEELPDTGVERALERLYSSRFIVSPQYGTLSSTALLLNRDRVATVWEQNFSSGGKPEQLLRYQWALDPLVC